ncbi:hypothetical protein L1987_80122 [Smallanthus sonchifolius]|uniref:Uncharacterized protein n=1 Tax=Smallanthus sonchifolius TaxID=185202 RepID=A0ACB8YMF5_9ASTR|nr:hypothetical protein L1987_80122 [Smallanthus sonchifolius]
MWLKGQSTIKTKIGKYIDFSKSRSLLLISQAATLLQASINFNVLDSTELQASSNQGVRMLRPVSCISI